MALVTRATLAALDTLSPRAILELFELRSRVFVVEQNCVYQDPDAADGHPETRHLLHYAEGGALVGYLRILPPGLDAQEPVIGRVVCAPEARGQGLAHRMLEEALANIAQRWPGSRVRLHAQTYLVDFYSSHGFQCVGEAYPLDGIPHQEMLRESDAAGR